MPNIRLNMEPDDALIVVDVQNDFCPGGLLPIEDGHKIVPVINRWIEAAVTIGVHVYASRDWHPLGHPSFQDNGGLWPPHCIQDSHGARFHPDLILPASAIVITKGVRFDQDQNSAFDQTGLSFKLKKDGIKRLWVSGLAEDVCVLATVTDGLKDGFEVILISKATKPITIKSGENARRNMRDAGAYIE
ncbi:isochorismatase family protein [Desulfobacterium sp. N47]